MFRCMASASQAKLARVFFFFFAGWCGEDGVEWLVGHADDRNLLSGRVCARREKKVSSFCDLFVVDSESRRLLVCDVFMLSHFGVTDELRQ